jgi:GTP diphosphokinase / guanosine-3',5'-bis(diphosphate) 3'-diphosphatase
LAVPGESISEVGGISNPVTILGTEGMTVQFARCCYPIPGDAIVGLIKKDQGLVIHTHDCTSVMRIKKESENVLDVTWGKDITRTFEVGITMTVVNQRGVLARVAAEIAKTDSNIDDVTMESDQDYTTMHFVLQAKNRRHLAQIMRGLRHIREIVKLVRVKN